MTMRNPAEGAMPMLMKTKTRNGNTGRHPQSEREAAHRVALYAFQVQTTGKIKYEPHCDERRNRRTD